MNSGEKKPVSLRKLLSVMFVLGALFATMVILALVLLGFIAPGPSLASLYAKPLVIYSSSDPNNHNSPFVPFYACNNGKSCAYHYGALAEGSGGFQLNVTSRVTGSFTSTNGIQMFVDTSALGNSFFQWLANGNGSAPGYVYTTGNVGSTTLDVTLPPGSYGIVFIDTGLLPSNLTITQDIAARSLST